MEEKKGGGEERERQGGQREGRGGRIKERKEGEKEGRMGSRNEKGRDGIKGKQLSNIKSEKERKGWRDGDRTLDSCSASSSLHSTSPGLNFDLHILPDF